MIKAKNSLCKVTLDKVSEELYYKMLLKLNAKNDCYFNSSVYIEILNT